MSSIKKAVIKSVQTSQTFMNEHFMNLHYLCLFGNVIQDKALKVRVRGLFYALKLFESGSNARLTELLIEPDIYGA